MKKIMLLIAFAGMLSYGHCQDVKVNINNQEATTKEDCAYRINGICSTEDIGGVDVEIIEEKISETYYIGYGAYRNYYSVYAVFTNYNKSTVSVLYEIGTGVDNDKNGATGSLVIQSNSSKRVLLNKYGYSGYSTKYYIRGMIARSVQ